MTIVKRKDLTKTGWRLFCESFGGIEYWMQAKELLIYNSDAEEVVGVYATAFMF